MMQVKKYLLAKSFVLMQILFIALPKALLANTALERLLIQMSTNKMLDKLILDFNVILTIGTLVKITQVHVHNLKLQNNNINYVIYGCNYCVINNILT